MAEERSFFQVLRDIIVGGPAAGPTPDAALGSITVTDDPVTKLPSERPDTGELSPTRAFRRITDEDSDFLGSLGQGAQDVARALAAAPVNIIQLAEPIAKMAPPNLLVNAIAEELGLEVPRSLGDAVKNIETKLQDLTGTEEDLGIGEFILDAPKEIRDIPRSALEVIGLSQSFKEAREELLNRRDPNDPMRLLDAPVSAGEVAQLAMAKFTGIEPALKIASALARPEGTPIREGELTRDEAARMVPGTILQLGIVGGMARGIVNTVRPVPPRPVLKSDGRRLVTKSDLAARDAAATAKVGALEQAVNQATDPASTTTPRRTSSPAISEAANVLTDEILNNTPAINKKVFKDASQLREVIVNEAGPALVDQLGKLPSDVRKKPVFEQIGHLIRNRRPPEAEIARISERFGLSAEEAANVFLDKQLQVAAIEEGSLSLAGQTLQVASDFAKAIEANKRISKDARVRINSIKDMLEERGFGLLKEGVKFARSSAVSAPATAIRNLRVQFGRGIIQGFENGIADAIVFGAENVRKAQKRGKAIGGPNPDFSMVMADAIGDFQGFMAQFREIGAGTFRKGETSPYIRILNEVPQLGQDVLGGMIDADLIVSKLSRDNFVAVGELLNERKFGAAAAGANDIMTSTMTIMNRVAEVEQRRWLFAAKLHGEMLRNGIDDIHTFERQFRQPQSTRPAWMDQSVRDSVQYALDSTFAGSPKSGLGKTLIETSQRHPFLASLAGFPFMKFLVNKWMFLSERSPHLLLNAFDGNFRRRLLGEVDMDQLRTEVLNDRRVQRASPADITQRINENPDLSIGQATRLINEERVNAFLESEEGGTLLQRSRLDAQVEAGRTLSQGMTGAVLWQAAMQLRNSNLAGPRWHDLDLGEFDPKNPLHRELLPGGEKGERIIIDVRGDDPISSFAALAEATKATLEGRSIGDVFNASDVGDLLFGLRNLQASGFAVSDAIRAFNSGDNPMEGADRAIKTLVGSHFGLYTVWLRLVKDFANLTDTRTLGLQGIDEGIIGDAKNEPLIGPFLQNLPNETQEFIMNGLMGERVGALPPGTDPFDPDPVRTESAIGRLFLGLSAGTQTNLERMIKRSGFNRADLIGKQGTPDANREMATEIARELNQIADPRNGINKADLFVITMLAGQRRGIVNDAIRKELIREFFSGVRRDVKDRVTAKLLQENPEALSGQFRRRLSPLEEFILDNPEELSSLVGRGVLSNDQ